MNRIYKVIWSKVKHQYVVVSELAHSCTKSTSSRIGRSAAAVLAALVLTTGVGALSVQAADPLVEDPYAILNDKIDETNANSSDPIVTLKSTAAAMNTDAVPAAGSDSQSGSSGNTSVATPSGQHTILNEDGFYAHNGQGTYNSLTKDGLFVGGTDNGEGLYVDNDGNIYTDGNAEVEGSLSAANRNFEVNEDGTLYARAGQSQFQVRGDLIGIQQGNSYIAVTEEDGAVFGNGTEGKETQINGDVVTTGTVNTTNLNAGKADIEGTMTAGSAVIEGTATVGGSLTAGSISTEGQLSAGSAVISGNATIDGMATVGGLTTEGTVTAANADITNLEAGKATIEGTLTAGSADITNSATVGGTLTAGDIETAGTVTAANADITNLTAGKATVEGTLTAGSADINGNAVVDGALTAGSLSTEGQLTAGSAAINGDVAITGTAAVGGLTTEGKITATNADITNLEAGKATVEGTVRAGSFANTNGSFTVDDVGDVEANDMTAKGDVSGATFANTTDTFAVDADGNVKAADITSTGDVTASGNVEGATFSNTNNTFSVNASGDVSAADVKASGALTGATIANANNSFKVDTSGNVSANNVTALNEVSGMTFTNTLNTFAVDADGNITGESIIVDGKTYISSSGLNANGSVISNVAAGVANTDAVNVGQLNAVDDKVDALDDLAVKYTDTNKTAIDLGTATLTTTGAISGGSVTVDGVTMDNGKITGLADGTADSDAVNKSQLDAVQSQIKTYTAGNGVVIDGSNVVSVKNGNGIGFDASGNVEVKAAQDGNIVVDTNGVSLSKTVSGLTSLSTETLTASGAATVGSLTTTGAISGGSVTVDGVTMDNGKITGLADGTADSDAVNKSQLDAVQSQIKTYTAGNGVAIDGSNVVSVKNGNGIGFDASGNVEVKAADDGNLEVDSNGVALKDDISLTSVTTSGAVTVGGTLGVTGATTLGSTLNVTGATTLGALTTNGTATFSQGASMNGQKITSVQAGTEGTDAVNKNQLDAVQSQIKTYTAGNGVSIDSSNVVSVKNGNGIEFDNSGNVTVKTAQDGNLVVDANGVSLSKTVSGLTSLSTDALAVTNNATVGGTLGVTGAVTAGSVTATGGFTIDMNNSLTSSGLTIGGTAYVTSSGLNAGNKVITGVANGVNDTDAVNMSQLNAVKEVSDLAVTYRNADKQAVDLAANNGTGTTITNVANGTLSSSSKEAVNGRQLYAVDEKVGDAKWSNTNFLNSVTDLTTAASTLDNKMGSVNFSDTLLLSSQTNLTGAIKSLDTHIGDLNFDGAYHIATNSTVTAALNSLDDTIGPMSFGNTTFLKNATTVSSALDLLDSRFTTGMKIIGVNINDDGTMSNTISWDGFNYISGDASVVTGMRNLDSAIKGIDDRVTNLETAGQTLSAFSRSNISTLSTLSNMDVSAVNALSSLSADDLSKLSEISVASDVSGAAETSGTNPTNNSGRPDRGPGSGADDSISHDGDTVTVDNNVKVTGDTDLQGNLNVGGDTTLGGKLEVGGDATFNGNVDMNGTLNMNGNKITGVADGEISADSTDAVNGSQLHDAWQQINSNTENIGILGSAVNKLGDRIERVGAGAAALAALHPLDFDPDNKLDFAAGFGNYRGASAVAVGAFYRPSENVMFSVGGAFGGGEDMVNAGVSFKVGAGSGSATTSRTAMAKSLKSMQEVVATQDAQLAQQREQIEKLTAMVELLMEQSGQTQPKDDGADTAQPQQ